MRLPYLWGSLHLVLGEFGAARRCFELLSKGMEKQAALFWRAMADYAHWRELGSSREEVLELVESLYPPAFYRRVRSEAMEDSGKLRERFPHMTCYDCADCAMSAAGQCLGAADAAAFAKIDAGFARSEVSQADLLVRLQELVG